MMTCIYLIKGGTSKDRREAEEKIVRSYGLSYGPYKGNDEIVLVLSESNEIFEGMTYERAKEMVGNEIIHDAFDRIERRYAPLRGIIDLDNRN